MKPVLILLGVLSLAGAAAGEPANDLRQFRLGMAAADLPVQGYVGFTCAAAPEIALEGWQDWRKCPAGEAGLHEIRFRYDQADNPMARVNDRFEGTVVAGHPVLLSLLIGADARLDGLRIETDPQARLYLRKKAFLFGEQIKARYGEDGWTCSERPHPAAEEPVGGVFLDERCEKITPSRHLVMDRALYRQAGQDVKEFTDRTVLTILPRS